MSDSDDDLFGNSDSDGGDTDDLIASSKAKKPAAKPKRLQKKKANDVNIPDADNDEDDDLEDSDDEETKEPTKTLSKRERMDKLKARRRAALDTEEKPKRSSKSDNNNSSAAPTDKGYESAASIDSAQYERTKEDDDFIDADGEDPDALKELYAEQHFNDNLEDMEDNGEESKKKGRKGGKKRKGYSGGGPDSISGMVEDGKIPDNPILEAVQRMKKKKKKSRNFDELKDAAVELITNMERAAEEDEVAIQERRPALKKLKMLQTVLDTATNREMVRPLLDASFLVVAKRWIEPLPNGTLGNVTLRQKMIHLISNMNGIDSDDLKQSEFGKLVMSLYMHKKEVPEMKTQLKSLIEQWSRRIFNKSGNMKDLDVANRRGDSSVGNYARAQASVNMDTSRQSRGGKSARGKSDLASIIKDGSGMRGSSHGTNRVSVPYSRGFQYSVRPENLSGEVADKRTRVTNNNIAEGRDSLHRRIMDKKRSSKNQRSANISVEGRPAK